MSRAFANVNLSTATFLSVIQNQINGLVYAFSTEIFTANSTLGVTTGNAQLIGSFTSNTVVASNGLRGGNATNTAFLPIISDVVISGSFLNSSANVNFSGKFVLSNTASFSNSVIFTGPNINASSNVNFTGSLNQSGQATFSNLVNFTANGTYTNTNLSVTGNGIFTAPVTHLGNTTITGTLNVSSNSILGFVSASGISTANIAANGSITAASVTANLVSTANLVATGNSSFGFNTINNPKLKSYVEDILTATVNTTSLLNLDNYNNFHLTMTSNTTFAFATTAPANTLISATLFIKQDATGNRKINWPVNVKWSLGNVPIISTGANQIDVFTFVSPDSGVTYFGTYSMANVS